MLRRSLGQIGILSILLAPTGMQLAPACAQAPGETAGLTLRTLSGTVTDGTGALLPRASVHLDGPALPSATPRDTTTDDAGRFLFHVPPGTYTLRVESAGFALFVSRPLELRTDTGSTRGLDVRLKLVVAGQPETIEVQEDGAVSHGANGDALVFEGHALDILSGDNATMQQQLQALAGGLGRTQILVDGFSGSRLPPKSSIRSIRLNNNPYSAYYDAFGFGRIEVATKPGTDKLHGALNVTGTNQPFDARNPYTTLQPPFYAFQTDGNVNGPLDKHTSFFASDNIQVLANNAVVNAVVLDPTLNPGTLSQALPAPQRTDTYALRLDRQFGSNNFAYARDEWSHTHITNSGIRPFVTPSAAFTLDTLTNSLQFSDTQVLGAHTVNETRFQYLRTRLEQQPNSNAPTLLVQGAFVGGGSPLQAVQDHQDALELQDLLEVERGTHAVRTGFRVRSLREANRSTENFNGQYTFDSIAAYQVTAQGMAANLSAAQIRAQGGGASQFDLTTGQPSARLTTEDIGLFAEDDWRLTPNLRLSYGLRFESQTAVPDHIDPAPRVALRWAVRHGTAKSPLVTLRGGAGLFYERFPAADLLRAVRQNGTSQTAYFVQSPDTYPALPAPTNLVAAQPTLYRVSPALRSAYGEIATLGADRNIGARGRIAATFEYVHNTHNYVLRNINAPLPGTYLTNSPGSGLRPLGTNQNIYQFSSDANGNTERFFTNANLQLTSKILLFGLYTAEKDLSETDDAEDRSATFVSNSYDVRADYGRTGRQHRQLLNVGLACNLPRGFQIQPYLAAQAGVPFNITTGADANGDTVFNDRPAFATDLTRASVVRTPYGVFDTAPIAGQRIIPRNYATAPALLWIDLQLKRDILLGPRPKGNEISGATTDSATSSGGVTGGRSDRPWDLQFSVDVQNLTNHNNPGVPIGVLTSKYFGHSLSLANDFSPLTASNRTIQLGASFTF